MGGSFSGQSAAPEFNIHCDPAAAEIVLQAGWPVTLLGLEVTRQAIFSRAEFAAIKDAHPAAALLKNQAAGWIARVEAMGWEKDGCALHDAAAAAYILDKSLFKASKAEVSVSTDSGPDWGVTSIHAASIAVRQDPGGERDGCQPLQGIHLGLYQRIRER